MRTSSGGAHCGKTCAARVGLRALAGPRTASAISKTEIAAASNLAACSASPCLPCTIEATARAATTSAATSVEGWPRVTLKTGRGPAAGRAGSGGAQREWSATKSPTW